MPYYDYHCDANGRTVEVRHRMSERVETWGELCELAGLDPADTALDVPVRRKVTAGIPLTGRGAEPGGDPAAEPPCGPACGCGWN